MACLEGSCLVVVHEVLSVVVWELDSIIGSCTSALVQSYGNYGNSEILFRSFHQSRTIIRLGEGQLRTQFVILKQRY